MDKQYLETDVRSGLAYPGPGDPVVIINPEGHTQAAAIRIRAIRCGKAGCTKCPHRFYYYARYTLDGKRHEKYLGCAPGEQ